MKLGSADLSNVRADPEETFNGERRRKGVCACGCVYYTLFGQFNTILKRYIPYHDIMFLSQHKRMIMCCVVAPLTSFCKH